MKVLLALLGVAIVIPLSILLHSVVIADLFNWFISPLGVMEINMPHAYGLSCFINIFHIGRATSQDVKDTDGSGSVIVSVATMFFALLFIWGFGAIAHSMM